MKKQSIEKFKNFVNKAVESISAFLHIILIFIVIIICSQAVAFCIIYLQLLNGFEITLFVFDYINIWNILSAENITSSLIYENMESVKAKIEFLMNVSIALSGILLSIVTFISYLRKNIEIARKSCFKKAQIFQSGKEDVEIMCKYFTGANYVAIHSHSFNWINKNENIKLILTDLSQKGKLKLFTSDNLPTVKDRLKDCNKTLINSIEAANVSLRFSYIERDNAKYLLYRQEDQEQTYVITVRENSESQYLLQVISQLVK